MNPVTIGRDPQSSIVVSEAFPRVSNNHATIEEVNGVLVYTDHSSNGTVINGNTVRHEKVNLTNGDHIMLAGEYLLAWPVLLNYFPNLQRRTMRFDMAGDNAAAPVAAAAVGAAAGGFSPAAGAPAAGGAPAGYAAGTNQMAPGGTRYTEQWRPDTQQTAPAGASGRGTEYELNHGGTSRENGGIGATGREGYNPGRGSSNEAGQLNSLTQSDIDDKLRGFNLGAFLGTWAWGLANRVYWPLAIIPLSFIPYLGTILSIFLCTYLGLNGNQIGWQRSKNISFPQWLRKQKRWIWIGAIVFLFCLAVQLLAFAWIMNMVF